MFSSIWDDVKQQFSYGNMVTRIILVNIGFFIVISLLLVFTAGYQNTNGSFIVRNLSLSSDLWFDLTHPWVAITHMFTHISFWHLLFNMLVLYWFGRIVGDLIGDRRILPIYLLGGLVGMIGYLTYAQLVNEYGIAYGASGAVMAIVVAAGFLAPDYLLRLILIGEVKLKYVVGVLLLIDLIGAGGNDNTGGHIAHLGGAVFGWLFVFQLRNGQDLAVPVNKAFDGLTSFFENLFSKRKKGPRMAYKNPSPAAAARGKVKGESRRDASHQDRLDSILDKIKKSGYESLSEEEKEFLFNASKK